MSQSNRNELRKLMASLDGEHADAVTKLIESNGFKIGLDDGDRAWVITALATTHGDPAFAESLRRLLGDLDYKSLDPDDRSALLRHIAGHATTSTTDTLLKEVQRPASGTPTMTAALKDWKAFVDGLKPTDRLGAHTGRGTAQQLTPRDAIPAADWSHPEKIVGRLTQVSEGVTGPNAEVRCGPSNLLAAALLRGREPAAQLLDRVANGAKSRLTQEEVHVLHGIAASLRSGNVSFQDLSLAQEALYHAGSTRAAAWEWRSQVDAIPNLPADKAARLDAILHKSGTPTAAELREFSQLASASLQRRVTADWVDEPLLGGPVLMLDFEPKTGAGRDGNFDGGLDDTELQRLVMAGGASGRPVAYDTRRSDAIGEVLRHLTPGESAIVHLPLNDRVGNRSSDANHFITVGVLPDGRPYIYNPAPQQNDATLVIGRAAGPQDPIFKQELAKYSQRANDMDPHAKVNALKSSP
jgi:hypothetical protein